MNPACVAVEQDKEWMSKAAWLQRHQEHLAIRDQGGHQLVLIGDSITQGWGGAGLSVFQEVLEPLGVANFGIAGDATQHVLWRIENGVLDGLSPQYVSMLIGTNNLGNEGQSGGDTAAGVITIFEQIRQRLPEAHVILNAVFPRDHEPDTYFRQQIQAINQQLRPLADDPRVSWLDMQAHFLDGMGYIPQDLMRDFLHLTAAGYELWGRELKKMLDL